MGKDATSMNLGQRCSSLLNYRWCCASSKIAQHRWDCLRWPYYVDKFTMFRRIVTHSNPNVCFLNPYVWWSMSYLIACRKPAGHTEVAPREFDVHSRWKLDRGAEEKIRKRRRIKRKRRRRSRTRKIKRRRRGDEDRTVKRKQLVWQVLAVTTYWPSNAEK